MRKLSNKSKSKAIAAIMLASVSLLALFFTSCSSLAKLTLDGQNYVDKKNNVTYGVSSTSYEPVSVGAEYAEISSSGTKLYKIGDANPKRLLTEEYNGLGGIYFDIRHPLPTLSDFGTNAIYICRGEVNTCVAEIHEQNVIDKMIEKLGSSENSYIFSDTKEIYNLKLASPDTPYVYYCLRYIICVDGSCFIEDRGEKASIRDYDCLLNPYLYGETETTEAETTEAETAEAETTETETTEAETAEAETAEAETTEAETAEAASA